MFIKSINSLKRELQVVVVMTVLGMISIAEMNAYENNMKCMQDPQAKSSTKKKAKSDSVNDAISYTTDEVPQDKKTLSKQPRFQGGDMNTFSLWVNPFARNIDNRLRDFLKGSLRSFRRQSVTTMNLIFTSRTPID